MGIEVRVLTAGALAELRRFSEAFDEPIDATSAERFVADDGHHLLLAYLDGEPAGFVSATEILHPDEPMELFLNELGVIESTRRHGVATALLDRLKGLAAELGAAQIWVLTDETNVAAVASYRRAGGVWDGERQIMFEIPPAVPSP